MKLNKSERHTAYIILLHAAEQPYETQSTYRRLTTDFGMCFMFKNITGISEVYQELEEYLPEYCACQKKSGEDWPSYNTRGWNIRKDWLKQCIKQTA